MVSSIKSAGKRACRYFCKYEALLRLLDGEYGKVRKDTLREAKGKPLVVDSEGASGGGLFPWLFKNTDPASALSRSRTRGQRKKAENAPSGREGMRPHVEDEPVYAECELLSTLLLSPGVYQAGFYEGKVEKTVLEDAITLTAIHAFCLAAGARGSYARIFYAHLRANVGHAAQTQMKGQALLAPAGIVSGTPEETAWYIRRDLGESIYQYGETEESIPFAKEDNAVFDVVKTIEEEWSEDRLKKASALGHELLSVFPSISSFSEFYLEEPLSSYISSNPFFLSGEGGTRRLPQSGFPVGNDAGIGAAERAVYMGLIKLAVFNGVLAYREGTFSFAEMKRLAREGNKLSWPLGPVRKKGRQLKAMDFRVRPLSVEKREINQVKLQFGTEEEEGMLRFFLEELDARKQR